ncbi:MAG: DUF475 domain-containing protein [Candidatus Saccharimonas sp.]
MKVTHPSHPLRIFWVSALLTLGLGGFVVSQLGASWLWIFTILVILEVTFSFDNAVINSKVLAKMSPRWQMVFLTLGIFIAVFLVRFLFPILIVMIASGNGFETVLNMALYKPDDYSQTLHHAAPMIDAFGGSFLIMIGVSYFMDRHKDIHWLGKIERTLAAAGRYENLKAFVMLATALVLYVTVDHSYRMTVLIACIIGIILHMGLQVFGAFFESKQSNAAHLVGMAAFVSFLYLEVLDASFSLDGVIGAFAITDNVLLIIAGLGAGAFWVRSLTIYLLRSGTLGRYRYLEHGAHWAILALGIVMFAKLYHIEPPEWMTGSLGLVFIVTAIVSSVLERRRKSTELEVE